MAEEQLTNASNDSATPAGQTQTNENATQDQQTPKQDAGKQTVNLRDLPEFKGYQEQFQRTVSHLNAELEQLKQQQHYARMEGMDELEKANYALQVKEQELAQMRQQQQQQQIQYQRWQDLNSLSSMTGAPVHALQNAETYDDAVKLSIQWMKENGATAKEVKEAKSEANRVDLGNGGASTPQDRESRERQDMLKRGDTRSLFLKILEE